MRLLSCSFRLCFKWLWLSAELSLAAFTYALAATLRSECRIKARARWLQQGCRRVLRVLDVEVDTRGQVPGTGLLVCNHLSYLDILVLGALTPAVFVAKREVNHWPVFGWFAGLAGTIFVDRERRTQVGQAAAEIQALLDVGQLVVLFPEGTSSDGKTVLPFKSSLLEPAANISRALTAAALRYEVEDGNAGEEVCYWKDMTFFPHLMNLLTKRRIIAHIRLSPVDRTTTCRKALARQLHPVVSGLKRSDTGLDTNRLRFANSALTV